MTTYRRRPNYDKLPQNKKGIQYFYRSLLAWGVVLTVEAGRLVIHAPGNNVSPVLEKSIRQREPALVKHLRMLEQGEDAGKDLSKTPKLGF